MYPYALMKKKKKNTVSRKKNFSTRLIQILNSFITYSRKKSIIPSQTFGYFQWFILYQ